MLRIFYRILLPFQAFRNKRKEKNRLAGKKTREKQDSNWQGKMYLHDPDKLNRVKNPIKKCGL